MSGSGASNGSSESDSTYVKVTCSPDPGFALTFDGLSVTEELGRPFLMHLDLSSGEVKGNIANMLGSSVTITMTAADASKTYFNGILTRIAYAGLSGGVYRYHAELRPWIWLLSRVQDCKIFQNQCAFDIINAVFKANGFSATDNRQNQAGSIVLEYCVQYRETSLDFVTRLMEHYGIYYYFTHSDGEHTLVLADDPSSHTSIGTIPFQFSQTEQRAVKDHVWDWTSDLHLQPGAYTYRDYNFTTPSADLTAKSLQSTAGQYGTLEVYDYPGIYDNATDGQTLAAVRMQELGARVQLFDGKTNSRALRCGAKFTLSGFADTSLNQEYLVTTATTSLSIAEGASAKSRGDLIDSQRVVFTAIAGTVTYRLEQRTPRPMIRGPQTALVVGDSGEEITTDSYGRIKVQFYWDRIGTNDQNSSCWIRVAQGWAGAGWGSMIIPRMGMEVVVAFLEGNPDRPLITGVVYNATNTVPNTLPDKKVLSTTRTNSSKGGGGFNEFTFDDTKGSENVFFQAQYNYSKKVLNNETVEITQDTATTVDKGNRSVTVSQGNDTHTVSQGNLSVTVSQGNHSTTVSAGNHSLSVSAGGSTTTTGQAFQVTANTSVQLTATTQIVLSCGPSSLTISPSGITISSPQLSATADSSMSLTGGASMSLTAAMISIN
jgi:type VI secretion system secreted protein VgrG